MFHKDISPLVFSLKGESAVMTTQKLVLQVFFNDVIANISLGVPVFNDAHDVYLQHYKPAAKANHPAFRVNYRSHYVSRGSVCPVEYGALLNA
ncbi:hypothetical protein DL89DRAFT_267479, partial [Linderina pennispora]